MPIEIYRPSHYTEPDAEGAGDSYGRNITVNTTHPTAYLSKWDSTILIVGDAEKLGVSPSDDAFMKYHWGPHASRPTQVVIPKGSIINAAKMTVRPSTTQLTGSTVRIGVLIRNPAVKTITPASWYADETTASEITRWQLGSELLNNGGVVNNSSVKGPVPGLTSPLTLDRLGTGSDGVHSIGQEHLVDVLTGPDAIIDEVKVRLAKVGTPGTNDVVVKLYDVVPTDSAGGGAVLLATSDAIDIAGLTTSLVSTSLVFTPEVNLGVGAQNVVMVLDGDFGAGELKTDTWFSGTAAPPFMHIFGRGAGFFTMPYPFERDLPHISGQADDTLNANLFGSTVNRGIGDAAWTQDVDVEWKGLEAMFQAQLDDAAFAAGDAMAVVVETLTGAIVAREMYSSAYLPSDFAPYLTIDFTPPSQSYIFMRSKIR